MATEQEKQMIDQLANQKLGVETQPLKDQLDQKAQQAGDPNVSGQDLTKEASKEPGGPEKATPQEQAAEAVSPKTEGDKQAEDGIRDQPRSRGLGDVYKRQLLMSASLDHFLV